MLLTKKCIRSLLILAFLLGTTATIVAAAPVQWSGNGHYYEAVEDPYPYLTWTEARAAAQAATFTDGLGQVWYGHLATLTSAAEETFISASGVLDGLPGLYAAWIWIGGYQTPTGQPEDTSGNMPSDNWHWVTGESWSYTTPNWAPNNGRSLPGQNEDYLVFFKDWWNISWDDGLNTAGPTGTAKVGYLIEYQATPIPLPPSALLLASGLLGLVGWRRFRKN